MSIARNIKNFKVLPSVLSQSTSTTSRIKSTRLCGGRTARPQTRRKVIYGGVVMDTETSSIKVQTDNSISLSDVSGVKRILIDLTDGDTERVNVRLDKGTDTTTEQTSTTELANKLNTIEKLDQFDDDFTITSFNNNVPEITKKDEQTVQSEIDTTVPTAQSEIDTTVPSSQVEESTESATETPTEESATETQTEEATESATETPAEPDTTVQVDESEKPESEAQTEEATESDTAQTEESSDVEQSENSVQETITDSEPMITPDTTTTMSDVVSTTVSKVDNAIDPRKTISINQQGGKSDYSAFIDKLFTQTVGGKKRVYSQKAIELNDKTTEIIKSVYPNITHEELKAVRSEIYQHIRNKYDPEVFRTLKDYEKAELLLKATTPSVLRKIDIEQAVIDRKRRIEERFNSDEETPVMSKKTASKKTTTKKATTKKTATKKATTKKATTKKETKTSKAIEKLKKKKSTRGGADLELPFHI